MSWRLGMVITTAVTMIFALAACQPVRDTRTSAGPVEKTLYIGAELVDCVGVAPMRCMQVKENPEDAYQFFYNEIEGFTFEPGFTYEVRVLVEPVANAPADASNLKYTLIEIVSPEPQMTVEQQLMAALGATAAYEIAGGELHLLNTAGQVVATFTVLEPVSLTGVTWVATMVNNGREAVVGLLEDTQITAVFDAEGKVGGSAGCNRYFAGYTVDGSSITIEPPASTRKM